MTNNPEPGFKSLGTWFWNFWHFFGQITVTMLPHRYSTIKLLIILIKVHDVDKHSNTLLKNIRKALSCFKVFIIKIFTWASALWNIDFSITHDFQQGRSYCSSKTFCIITINKIKDHPFISLIDLYQREFQTIKEQLK